MSFCVIIHQSRKEPSKNNNPRRMTMSNPSTTITSVLDSKSTNPEKKNSLNILLWESLVIQMLNLPHAA